MPSLRHYPTQKDLLTNLSRHGLLKNPRFQKAFLAIDRADFIPPEFKHQAYLDTPLPIGYEQTISQPYTVAFMLELLQPDRGHNILDIGSGSGWQTALLAHIVGPKGHVTALELVPKICEYGTSNLQKYSFIEKGIIETHCLNAQYGYSKNSPYGCIIAAASLQDTIPLSWLDQLKTGGHLVTPLKSSLVVVNKTSTKNYLQREIPGFTFVPFINH